MPEQLTLGLPLQSSCRFDAFIPEKNAELFHVLTHLQDNVVEKGLYLWGNEGVGKTHLLQASCHAQINTGATAIYLAPPLDPACIEAVAHVSLIVIDDLDVLLQDVRWESAIYQLYNQLSSQLSLIVSSKQPLSALSIQLPDLRSRLSALANYHVEELDDTEKRQVISAEANRRGLELSAPVCDYLFHHFNRSLSCQMNLLNQLDKASLVSQRRLTVPFIKEVMSS